MWVDNARWLIGTAESVCLSELVRARATVCVCVCVSGAVSVCIAGCPNTQRCVRACVLRVVLAHRVLRSRTCVCMDVWMCVCVCVWLGVSLLRLECVLRVLCVFVYER